MSEITYEQLYELLDIVKESDTEYDFMAGCPVHGGSDSLHVWMDDDDKLGVHCFACGANVVAVGEALGLLDSEDNEPEEGEEEPSVNVRRVKTADAQGSSSTPETWQSYIDDKELDPDQLRKQGGMFEDALRDLDAPVRFYFGTDCYKERTADGFRWHGGKAKDLPLWPPITDEHLPETIHITEGETDMLTLRQLGYAAYAITAGADAKGWLTTDHYIGLRKRGVSCVVLAGDADTAGRDWVKAELPRAQGAQLSVGIVNLTPYYDRWGFGIKDLNELWQDCDSVEQFVEMLEDATHIEAFDPPLLLDRIREVAEEPIEWLVEELVSPNEKGLIVGREKTYKTWIALDLMKAVATGSSFLNREDWFAEAGHPVLLIEEEGSKKKFAKRVQQVFEGIEADFHLWFRRGFRLTDDSQTDELIEYVREHGIKLVVLDPLQRMMPGVDENSNTETGAVWDNIHRLSYECAVVVVHHANKTGTDWRAAFRGASRTGGEVDFVLYVQPGESSDEKLRVHVDGRDLVKYEDQQGYLAVQFEDGKPWTMNATGWKVNVSTAQGRQEARSQATITDALAGGSATFNEILEAVGGERNVVKRQLLALVEDEIVQELPTKPHRTYELREDS